MDPLNPSRTKVVLIGGSTYTDLPHLRAVAANLDGLSRCFLDANILGVGRRNLAIVRDPVSASEVIDPIEAALRELPDTILIYYAGHGLIDPFDNQLLLSLTGSTQRAPHKSMPFEWLRRVVVDSTASRRIVILDCCYSGRALQHLGDESELILNDIAMEGTFVLTASAENVPSIATSDGGYTAFTNELLDLLEFGEVDGPTYLELDYVYSQLTDRLRAKSLPTPQKRVRNFGGSIALARNTALLVPSIGSRKQRIPIRRSAPDPNQDLRVQLRRHKSMNGLGSPEQISTRSNARIPVMIVPESGQIAILRKGENVLGRSQQVDIRSPNTFIDRSQAIVHWDGEKLLCWDSGDNLIDPLANEGAGAWRTTNPTLVNGVRRATPTLLNPGDVLGVGEYPCFKFELLGPAQVEHRVRMSYEQGRYWPPTRLHRGSALLSLDTNLLHPLTFSDNLLGDYRFPENNIVWNNPNLSPILASIRVSQSRATLTAPYHDASTIRINGVLKSTATLNPGDEIDVASQRFVYIVV